MGLAIGRLAWGMRTAIDGSAAAGPTAPATISAPSPPIITTSAAMIAGAHRTSKETGEGLD